MNFSQQIKQSNTDEWYTTEASVKLIVPSLRRCGYKKILQILIVITFVTILVLMVFLKIWVVINYGDMPITEVPSWAIPWMTYGGR